MTKLPSSVAESDLAQKIENAGLTRIHQGKVRDSHILADGRRVFVATDRISIFDFVLPALVEDKGPILTAMTIFWLTKVLKSEPHHLELSGSAIDPVLPEGLREHQELQARTMIVKPLDMLPVECIVRGFLTGSGWRTYEAGNPICGIPLPDGLHDGSEIDPPIFTPTTKAEVGHDENIDRESVQEEHGAWPEETSLRIYGLLAAYADEHGVILADTKFELGKDGALADEVATPDSSRFWDKDEWKQAAAKRQSPTPFDKELARNWGKTVETPFDVTGLHHLTPDNPEHLSFVHQLEVPAEVLQQTTDRYRTIFQRLTGMTLEQFQRDKMHIV